MLRKSARKSCVGGVVPLAFALVLSGCGAEEKLAEKATEEAIEAAGDGAEVDIDGDEMTVTDENGDSASIGTSLPEDFPSDDVPLLDGTIVSATATGGTSFMVMMDVEGEPEAVHDEALGQLTGAGYSEDTDMSSEGYYATTMTKDGFRVGVTSVAGSESGVTQVQYVVTVG